MTKFDKEKWWETIQCYKYNIIPLMPFLEAQLAYEVITQWDDIEKQCYKAAYEEIHAADS